MNYIEYASPNVVASATYGDVVMGIPDAREYGIKREETDRAIAKTVLETLIKSLRDTGFAVSIVPPSVPVAAVKLVTEPLESKGWIIGMKELPNGDLLFTANPPGYSAPPIEKL